MVCSLGVFDFNVKSLFENLFDNLIEEAGSNEFVDFYNSEEFEQEEELEVTKLSITNIILIFISSYTFNNQNEWEE